MKPWYQDITRIVTWLITGFVYVGALLDVVSNSVQWITPSITYVGTLIVFIGFYLIRRALKKSPLLWIDDNGQKVYIKSLGSRPQILLAGVLLALWLPRIIRADVTIPDVAESFPIGEDVLQTYEPPIVAVSSPILWKSTISFFPGHSLLLPPSCLETDSGIRIGPIDKITAEFKVTMPEPNPANLLRAYVKLDRYERYDKVAENQVIHHGLYADHVTLIDNPLSDTEQRDGLYILPAVNVQPFTERKWIWSEREIELRPDSVSKQVSFLVPIEIETYGKYDIDMLFQVRSHDGTVYLIGTRTFMFFGPAIQSYPPGVLPLIPEQVPDDDGNILSLTQCQ